MKSPNTVKRLPHYQVVRVMSRTREAQKLMFPISTVILRGPVMPTGCYAVEGQKIILPKRRRGEKFIVHYTTIHEAVL